MTQLRKRAILTMIIWGIVLIVFVLAFFIDGGAVTYAEKCPRRLISNICIAAGYAIYALMLLLTRTNPDKKTNLRDERDNKTIKEANNVSLTGILIYVFLLCIYLWDRHQNTGSVPVGYMWFLAYSTIGLSYFFTSLVTLITDWRNSANAES